MDARWLWILLLAALPAVAEDADGQVEWRKDWAEAFQEARRLGRPVMVCINSKDGESASDRTARVIYRDPGFVALSREFVMLVVSTRVHAGEGTCPRFGRIRCEDHVNCWKELRARYADQFVLPGSKGGMISPQHAWFSSDGTLLRRKEYELSKAELLRRMRLVLRETDRARERPPPEGGAADRPLDDHDRAELERVRGKDEEARAAALGNLLATEKTAVHRELTALLASTKDTGLKCAILHALGRAQITGAHALIEEQLADREARVRSFAAVALEDLALLASAPALIKRARRERNLTARKNMLRALGACAGPAADKAAARTLLHALFTDKQNVIRKHAALSMRPFGGKGASLVVPKLEQAAPRTKDPEVRGGIVYTLASIGNPKTTLPIFEKLLDKTNVDYVKRFLRAAIRVLKKEGGDFGRSGRFLFREDRDDPAREG